MSMNHLSFLRFLLVFSLIMMVSNTSSSYITTVWIRNKLQNQNDLIVHCKSAKKIWDTIGCIPLDPTIYFTKPKIMTTLVYGVIYGKDLISSITKCLMFTMATYGKLEKMESMIDIQLALQLRPSQCMVGMFLYQKLLRWDQVVSL
ncbi:unnamed protein product [Arabis nemorensis]|uniref:Uncharacterized protein n=1 Tax=Arabis nemorensis TaxID=586526 RepID=A0A565B9V9_9BRAS|nr:unnamed protein product [Arabis nemorensis]